MSYDKHCTYCGCDFECRDHVIPACTQEVKLYSSKVCVSCCTDCNTTLGAVAIHTIPERAKYLTIQLKKRKLLNMPDWNKEDIAYLGDTLKSEIESSLEEKQLLLKRIANTERVAEGQFVVPMNDFIDDKFALFLAELAKL